MKKLITIVLLVFSFAANATTYYFAASGSDANTGTSTSSPWKTLSKFNSVFASKSPGDNFLFNRGDIFYGNMVISRSGTSSSRFTVGAYGTGANPVITGFTTVTAWTNLGNNIWESTNAISTLASTNMVAINKVCTPMGRYPNSGYLTYQSYSGNTSITSSSLNSGVTNWTGAEVVVRKNRWNMDRNKITAQSGGTLTFSAAASTKGSNNFGFFIQNDIRTLDAQNEWYYNPSTKKIRVYSTTTPVNVQVATKDTLVNTGAYSYITFNNISFQGENKIAVKINKGQSISIQNCDFNYSGLTAVDAYPNSPSLNISNCTFNHTNDYAINAGSSTSAIISNNTVKNTGTIPGMAAASGAYYKGIHSYGNYSTVSYNTLDSVGYIGIEFDGDGSKVLNNVLTNFGFVLDDGAGIYTFPSQGTKVYVQRSIKYNILINGGGAGAGTDNPASNQEDGIYLDGTSPNCDIIGNSVVNVNSGLSLNNAHEVKLDSNTAYNCIWQYYLRNYTTTVALSNISFHNNILVARLATQLTTKMEVLTAALPSSYSSDYNYFARPIDDNMTIQNSFAHVYYPRTLALWQTASGYDAHSKKSPKTITTVNDLRFEYNGTTSSKTITLDAKYIDVRNVTYNGTITLAPFTSAVLIRNGAATNQSPVAKAGSDQGVTLPTTTVSLAGSGTDADGSIVAYAWTKISGTGGTITSGTSAATTVTGLAQGAYSYQLKVTDNAGATALDTVLVTVNASGGLLPAVNPANTVNGLDYKYYEASDFVVVPKFSSLTPVKTGTTSNVSLSYANRTTVFAFNFTGYISVPSDGQYTFYVNSDDGSNLYIDNVLVVNNDQLHTAVEKSGTIGLKAGKHAISIGYFQRQGDTKLTVSYSGPGVTKVALPSASLYRVSGSGLLALSNNSTVISDGQVGIKAYPNPFMNYIEVNITGGAAGDYKLLLVDALGRVLWTRSGNKSAGSFQQSISTSALEKGIYFLKIIQNNTSSVIKLAK